MFSALSPDAIELSAAVAAPEHKIEPRPPSFAAVGRGHRGLANICVRRFPGAANQNSVEYEINLDVSNLDRAADIQNIPITAFTSRAMGSSKQNMCIADSQLDVCGRK
jgi:hypothetical protein